MNDKNREMSEGEQCLNTNCKYYDVFADQNCDGAANGGTAAEFCKNWNDNKISDMPENLQKIIDDFNRPPAPYLPDTENAIMFADLAEHEKIRGDTLAAAYRDKCEELETMKKEAKFFFDEKNRWWNKYDRLLEVAHKQNKWILNNYRDDFTYKNRKVASRRAERDLILKQFEELEK